MFCIVENVLRHVEVVFT